LASKITIPAVKITGNTRAPTFPDLPTSSSTTNDTLLTPDPCLSDTVKLDPIDSALFPSPATEDDSSSDAVLSTDEEEESELGAFLMDAVEWL